MLRPWIRELMFRRVRGVSHMLFANGGVIFRPAITSTCFAQESSDNRMGLNCDLSL